jgi:sirohydrochlorin ferrochelatase
MLATLLALVLLSAPSSGDVITAADTADVPGLLVMAHGGGPEWDAAVYAAVAPLRSRYPVAVAFGMADPRTLLHALDSLATQGARRVAVVRLFMDGRSFRHQTEYLLGLRDDPPGEFLVHGSDHAGGSHGGRHGVSSGAEHSAPEPLRHPVAVAISEEGLMEAEEVGAILAARAQALSEAPAQESVLVLAHGTESDVENARWIAAMEHASGPLRALGFHSVRVETLREDWPERRAEAERRIRSFVEAEAGDGRTVLVVPFRLFGFGPYHDVLDGLKYRAADTGLLPHEAIADWMDAQYRVVVAREGWARPSP